MKIAVIGSGFMGGVHMAAIQRIPGATLAALASRTRPSPDTPTRGNLAHVQTAPLPAHVKWFADWQQLLLDPEIEAVDICLPTYIHRPVALRAFELGKHVLCEKPMALSTEDCNAMMLAAETSGRTFMIAQVLRFAFPYEYAADFVNHVGRDRIIACTLSRSAGFPQWSDWVSREDSSGGAILDLHIHDIDMALHLFGQPQFVRAISNGPIDTMHATLHYATGLDVMIQGGWLAPEIPFSAGFKITTTESTLTHAEGKLHVARAEEETIITIPQQDEYQNEIAYFIHCCQTNLTPTRCTPQSSAQAVHLANLLKQSRANNGQQISL